MHLRRQKRVTIVNGSPDCIEFGNKISSTKKFFNLRFHYSIVIFYLLSHIISVSVSVFEPFTKTTVLILSGWGVVSSLKVNTLFNILPMIQLLLVLVICVFTAVNTWFRVHPVDFTQIQGASVDVEQPSSNGSSYNTPIRYEEVQRTVKIKAEEMLPTLCISPIIVILFFYLSRRVISFFSSQLNSSSSSPYS